MACQKHTANDGDGEDWRRPASKPANEKKKKLHTGRTERCSVCGHERCKLTNIKAAESRRNMVPVPLKKGKDVKTLLAWRKAAPCCSGCKTDVQCQEVMSAIRRGGFDPGVGTPVHHLCSLYLASHVAFIDGACTCVQLYGLSDAVVPVVTDSADVLARPKRGGHSKAEGSRANMAPKQCMFVGTPFGCGASNPGKDLSVLSGNDRASEPHIAYPLHTTEKTCERCSTQPW